MKRLFIAVLITFVLIGCGKKTEEEIVVTPTPTPPKDTIITFVGVGDNLIHEMIYIEADKNIGAIDDGTYDFKPFYENVRQDIQTADVAFINQETILGGTELTLSGYPMFNSPSEVAKDMSDLGFNMFNLATNHALDQGLPGIRNTMATLDKLDGIIYNGIFTNDSEAKEIPVLEKNDIRIALLSYTYKDLENPANDAYGVPYFDEKLIREQVSMAKKISDIIIVSAHWGIENTSEPTELQKEYAQLFADVGVNVVIGTHSHTVQPVEWIRGVKGNDTLVSYSLGNFMGSMLSVDNILSGMIHFDIVRDATTNDLYIENAKWTPLVIHYEGDQNNIYNDRHSHMVYKLSDYTDELAKKHILTGYGGQVVDIDTLWDKTNSTISSFYLRK